MEYKIIRNDITNMGVDAIVLPANRNWTEGQGTSAAIFEKAGRSQLKAACAKMPKGETGQVQVTLGYGLPSDYIIHAVVPKWKDGKHKEYDKLIQAYISSLVQADIMGCKSIAFPLLAAGNNGFDQAKAFEAATISMKQYQPGKNLEIAYIVLYSSESMALMRTLNIPVEEKIDEKYVLRNNEDTHAKKMIEAGLEQGKRVAYECAQNPEVQRAASNAIKKLGDYVEKQYGLPVADMAKKALPVIQLVFEAGEKVIQIPAKDFRDVIDDDK